MGKPSDGDGGCHGPLAARSPSLLPLLLRLLGGLLAVSAGSLAQEYGCPPQDKILPCRCSTRDMEFQIWCSHSELPRVLEGLKAVSRHVVHPVDELILENNNLPSLPGHVFASLRVLRLMLRNNRLERVSSGWLEGLQDSLLELFLVEPELRSLPVDSLDNLQGLEAVTIQSKLMKRLPSFTGLSKLRYLQINSPTLLELSPRNFRDLPALEQLHVFGSPKLSRLEAGWLRDLPRLQMVNVSDCGIQWMHPRALINLPELKELALPGNLLHDANMLGRAVLDLPALSVLQLDRNRIVRLPEGSFVDLPNLARLTLSENRITEIMPGAFQGLTQLRTLNLNHNRIHRIHPEFFISGRGRSPSLILDLTSGLSGIDASSLEEIWLMDNDIGHISELRSVLEALPRLKFLEASHNHIQELRYGALRPHSSLERLHLDYNRLSYLQRDAFSALPALRELRLSNNSLENSPDAPFWDLPALKGLDLSGNYFRHLEPRVLSNLPNLRRLDLSRNAIALVEPDAFINTPALEHVNMSGNALSVLHPMTFRHLTNLYELDAGWNRLLEIIPGLPRNLEHLRLPMNRIVALPASLSSDSLALPLLRTLDLSANGIEHLPPGALMGLPSLRKLDLGFNALSALEDASLEGLGRLEQLDLRYNRIGLLHGRCFAPLRNLLDLSLRGNRLELLRHDIFKDNVRLQRVDLSRNNINVIPHATFTFTRDLRELHASYNGLSELPSSLHGLGSLQILDLSYNKLQSLAPETLSSLSNLLELKLARNRIRELREGAFDRMPRLSLVDLENNELTLVERNAVRGLPELQAVHLGKNKIQMIPSGAFNELPMLQSVELQENRIQELASNAFINVPHLLFLNLSHNVLTSLDHMGLDSMRSLEVLDLSDNRITKVSSESLSAMEWLVELKMDNNRICAIQGSPFDDMPRLRVLSLRSNRMASVAENAFRRLRSNIAVLDIDGNPLSCSCGMLWLRGWLQQASADGPRCADGSLFREIRLSRQDCQRDRQLEPVHPGCELDASSSSTSPFQQNSDLSPSRTNVKSPPKDPTQDTEYMYDDYNEYAQESNSSDASNVQVQQVSSPAPQTSLHSSSSAATETATFPNPTKTSSLIAGGGNSNKIPAALNKKKPPPPSTSGFTFFGMPLPSLNFNLWGNTGKKADRKEDGESSLPNPTQQQQQQPRLNGPLFNGRVRYRNFPPTEPEIHRGGFVPMPRGQGGFLPIADPRLNGSSVYLQEPTLPAPTGLVNEANTGPAVGTSRQALPPGFAVAKVERTTGPPANANSLHGAKNAKSRLPLNENSNKPSPSFSRKQPPRSASTNAPSTVMTTTLEDVGLDADESLVSTEIYSDSTEDELASTTTQHRRPVQSFTPRYRSIITTTSTTAMPELEIITTDNINMMNEMGPLFGSSSHNSASSHQQQASRALEASALSSIFSAGGSNSVNNKQQRATGRPSITKLSSPYVDDEQQLQQQQYQHVEPEVLNVNEDERSKPLTVSKIDSQSSASAPKHALKPAENPNLSWYYQQYNNSDKLESYVGFVYEDESTSSSSSTFNYGSSLLANLAIPLMRYLLVAAGNQLLRFVIVV
ncbi:hypothetical protein QAD02_022830 [Eretmocerus hayati]|uniref:Uncharacterized protein n=1 Tax=Eretmocerus hayati TaxID=131215 RepID=A0ACC2PU35_9HYME|nr:hypothetical protein QAD02_022830 [Eretmocerus hayati]